MLLTTCLQPQWWLSQRRHVSKLKSVPRRHRPHHYITITSPPITQSRADPFFHVVCTLERNVTSARSLKHFRHSPLGPAPWPVWHHVTFTSLIGLICCHVIGWLDVCSECIYQYCNIEFSCIVNRAVFRYNLLFFLSGGGKFNYQGTKRWLEDNLDHTGIVQQSHTNPWRIHASIIHISTSS